MVSLAAVAALLCEGSAVAQQTYRTAAPPGSPTIPYRAPQSAAQPPVTTYRPMMPLPTGASSGSALYYQKPANALTATGSDQARDLAQVSGTVGTPPGLPETPQLPSPPMPNRGVELPPVTELTPSPGQAPIAFPQPPQPLNQPQMMPGPAVAQPPALGFPRGQIGPRRPIPLPKCDNLPEHQPKTPIPGPGAIFIMYDDRALELAIVESLRLENPKLPAETRFPLLPCEVYPQYSYVAKTAGYEPRTQFYAPTYVVHRRLHFEEKNSERYGWDLGIIQPFVSTVAFYKDTLLWPNSLITSVVRGPWDTSAGKCLPGSPVPYYLYPPGLTISGTLFEMGLITGLSFIIP